MDLIMLAREAALVEIERYGTPHRAHLALAEEKGVLIAQRLGADVEIVRAGTLLMDLKLGEAIKAGRAAEHVAICADAADARLREWGVPEAKRVAIVACVAEHHNATGKFSSLEAEITANADCYRFLHPVGFMTSISLFSACGLPYAEVLKNVEAKLEEKHKILSLAVCREELEARYQELKRWLAEARGLSEK